MNEEEYRKLDEMATKAIDSNAELRKSMEELAVKLNDCIVLFVKTISDLSKENLND